VYLTNIMNEFERRNQLNFLLFSDFFLLYFDYTFYE